MCLEIVENGLPALLLELEGILVFRFKDLNHVRESAALDKVDNDPAVTNGIGELVIGGYNVKDAFKVKGGAAVSSGHAVIECTAGLQGARSSWTVPILRGEIPVQDVLRGSETVPDRIYRAFHGNFNRDDGFG